MNDPIGAIIDIHHVLLDGPREVRHVTRPNKPKSRIGPNVPDTSRHTVAVKLRLAPESARDLRELAEERGRPVSRVVEELVEEARDELVQKAVSRILGRVRA